MILSPTNLTRDPAVITFGGEKFTSVGDIVVSPVIERFAINSSIYGMIDNTRMVNRKFTITFTPVGQFEALDVLFDALSKTVGESLIGATSTPLVINTQGGKKWTFINAAVTKMPTINLGTKRTLFGPVEITAILGIGLTSAAQASYYTVGDESFPADAGFDPTLIYTQAYAAEFAASGTLAAMYAREGWTITPTVKVLEEVVDGVGTIDLKVADATVMARGMPAGPAASELWALMHLGTELGASRHASARALNFSATGVYIRLEKALLQDGPVNFGQGNQVGEFTWEATRQFSGGVMTDLLTIGSANPDL